MDIEKAATSEIENRISNTDLLLSSVNSGDKEPVWDGFIYAYKNSSKKNEELIGRVPVQVKGHETSNFNEKSIRFRIQTCDLISYRNDGGVLYFVVYVAKDGRRKIYYAALLPYVLNQYISLAGTKKSIYVSLKTMPNGTNTFERIALDFIHDRKRQVISQQGKNWTMEEVVNLLGRENIQASFHFTTIGKKISDPIEYFDEISDFYLYAENKEGTMTFPIEHLGEIEIVKSERNLDISVGQDIFYTKLEIVKDVKEQNTQFNIGKSFKLIVEKQKYTFKYKLKGNLAERIDSLKFLIAALEAGVFSIGGIDLPFNPNENERNEFPLEKIKQVYNRYSRILSVLNKTGVQCELDLDASSELELISFDKYADAILYDEYVEIDKPNLTPLGFLDISNVHILFLLERGPGNKYKLKDYFRTKIDCCLSENGEYDTSQFCVFNKEEYLKASNLDIEVVEESFKEHHNVAHYERVTLSILEMIKAYDENNSREELLDLARRIIDWQIRDDSRQPIYVLNMLQCELRKRELTFEEVEELETFTLLDDERVKWGAYILLKNKQMAQHLFEKFSQEEKEQFREYPIYTIYEKL